MTIPIGVTAKNEARALPVFLKTLTHAVKFAEDKLKIKFEITFLLNDTTDNSEEVLLKFGKLNVAHTTGGLVEAQRHFSETHTTSPFLIYSDADILIEENAIYEISKALLETAKLQVAYSEKIPLKAQRETALAKALYLYNLNNGYQSRRHYFNGQLFGIRDWNIPKPQQLKWDLKKDSNYLNLKMGIRCDDIYLSRHILLKHGPEAIRCVNTKVYYRPPATLIGMYRKYQRMCLEIERLNHYFPESLAAHQKWGRRRLKKSNILKRPLKEILYYGLFLSALALCKAFLRYERLYYSYLATEPCPTWKPVTETKAL